MSDSSRAAYIWVSILGLVVWVLGIALEYVRGWESAGVGLTQLGFAILLFSVALLLYSKA